jgi:hypothetical protein
MKVLLDECVPRKLRRELPDHEVFTVTERGWSGIKNGKLLALAEVEFDVFLTVDQNLKYQQNLKAFNIGIIMNYLTPPLPKPDSFSDRICLTTDSTGAPKSTPGRAAS